MAFFKKKSQEKADKSLNPLDSVTTSTTLETQHKGEKVVGSIIDNSSTNVSKMLDVTPDINQALLDNLQPPKSILLTILKAMFVISILLGGAMYVFFSSQTTSKMQFVNDLFKVKGTNAQLIDLNEAIIENQTELNFYTYMQIKGYLDDFIEHGANFTQAYQIATSESVSDADKNDAKAKMSTEREALKIILGKMNEKLAIELEAKLAPVDKGEKNEATIEVPSKTLFTNALLKRITIKYNEWAKSETSEGLQKMKNYGQVKDLVKNREFKPLLLNLDIDSQTDEEMYKLLNKLNEVIVSDLSTIEKIKSQRVIWSDVMKEIEKRTKMSKAGMAYKGMSEMGVGIFYTNYDFNAQTRKVSVTGSIKTDESNTFTQHIDLMQKLNESPMFSDADIDTFTKTGGNGEPFMSSIRFNLTLN